MKRSKKRVKEVWLVKYVGESERERERGRERRRKKLSLPACICR